MLNTAFNQFNRYLLMTNIELLLTIETIVLVALCIFLVALIIVNNRLHTKEMTNAQLRFNSLFENINGGMIVAIHATTAQDTIVTFVSQGFTNMTGYTIDDINTLYNGRYLDVIIDEDRPAVFEIYLKQLATGNTYRMPYRIRKKDGSILWVMDNGYLVNDVDGLRNHSLITDISIIKNQEQELQLSEKRFSIAINASSGALFEVNLKTQTYTHFENAERIFGVEGEKLLADTHAFTKLPYDQFVAAVTTYFFHEDDRKLANDIMIEASKNGNASYEARLRRGDNSYIWTKIDLTISKDKYGKPESLIGLITDIDDVKKQTELLQEQVLTDSMTNLYNKVAMMTLSSKILQNKPNQLNALIVLDIDNFKGLNDMLGHAFGDIVLIESASKLKGFFHNLDLVSRMGGDEFAILMVDVPDTRSVLKKVSELSLAFRQKYAGEKEDYTISCSLGVYMIDNTNETFDSIYRKADSALYMAKQNGKDQFVLYNEADADQYPIETSRTNDEELQNLKTYHNIEEHIFELLYSTKNFNTNINMAIATIGQQYHVSRVSIFENDATNTFSNNTYEWCNDGIKPAIDYFKNIKIDNGNETLLSCFDQNGLFYCNDVRELPPYFKQLLQSKDTLSTLQLTIANEGKICGFIGFDECTKYRVWTAEEIEKLSYISKVLSIFLFKQKTESAVLANLNTRLKILDALPDYICVVNPQTHSIEYANKKMRELLPQVYTGAFCFSALRGGQNAPCKTCLVERIKAGDTDNLEIVSEDNKTHLKIDAITINWTNEQKMVLMYGDNQD